MNCRLNKLYDFSLKNHKNLSKFEYRNWKAKLHENETNQILRLLTCIQIATKINSNDHLVRKINYF